MRECQVGASGSAKFDIHFKREDPGLLPGGEPPSAARTQGGPLLQRRKIIARFGKMFGCCR